MLLLLLEDVIGEEYFVVKPKLTQGTGGYAFAWPRL